MSKRLLNVLIIIALILLIISAFEILNVESYYEDQEFVHAPANLLRSLKHEVALMEAITGFCVVALIYLLILKNKKSSVNTLPQ